MTTTYTSVEHPRTAKVFGERQLLSITQFARALGVNPATAWRWKTSGTRGYRLPTERFGGRVLITRAGFDAWHRAVNTEKDSTVAA